MERRQRHIIYRLNQWRMQKISNRNFMVLLAVVVGIVGGLAAAALKGLTHYIAAFLQDDLQWQYKYYLYLFFPLIGILLSVLYVRRFIRKGTFEHGMTPIIYAISRKSSRIQVHNIYSQIITSALTVGFGGSAGLEAPIAYSGSAIGANAGRFFGLNYREVTMLLACGAAAGIAGAFNSPVAGMIFAIEILLPEFSIPAFIPLLMAAATASVVSKLIYSEPLFHLVTDDWEFQALFFYLLLAVLIGLFSIYFAKISVWVKSAFAKIKNPYQKVWVSGLSLGLMIFLFPSLYGEGYISIQRILDGRTDALLANSIFADYQHVGILVTVYAVITVFAKSAASLITLSSGGNGGIFGPSLVMGGLLGFAFSYGINLTGLIELNVPNFVVAGMAAALSGIMHAPLTGIFLIAEITGGYALMVPLMLVTAISYLINRTILKYSIYTKALAEQGDLLTHEDKDRTVLSMMKLRYVLERNFTILRPDERPADRRYDIIHTKRNIFPVVDTTGKLLGIIYSERLFEILLGENLEKKDQDKTMRELAEKPVDIIQMDVNMEAVMQKMNREDIWILPVVDADGNYMGFVSKSAVFNKYRALLMRQATYLE
ncbi:chloride channel protein [Parapedobacter indicus]|uniref:Chloride channel protein, CIC family n=1 Tax=Parapedobacter indicus TaxID=1477437 RepID=A0A1I3DBQ7_9SPHI|nr:chloride channel protein [Parapedobacter indicus]PPL04607.1 CIC family chloride channel protein [Parapedobacter indicus]SFH84155.1 chloride channel protein, CIC family [Parapedobacter indicus]